MTAQDIVLDTSALVVYAENDFQTFPLDELLDELRYDTGGRAFIPWFALEDAQRILRDDRAGLRRLQDLVAEFGVELADTAAQRGVEEVALAGKLTAGSAHAMLLAVQAGCRVATFAALTLRNAGFRQFIDLEASFPPE